MHVNNILHENSKTHAQRYVFNGVGSMPMFYKENLDLPSLNDGEVLVKVRTATICLSDIHTVCGTRTEPTPR
jgi:threonine dehydrogenase-like Zn-dependent dehydrogenase